MVNANFQNLPNYRLDYTTNSFPTIISKKLEELKDSKLSRSKIVQLCYLAAVKVLKDFGQNLSLYLTGINTLSDKQITQINAEFDKLKINMEKTIHRKEQSMGKKTLIIQKQIEELNNRKLELDLDLDPTALAEKKQAFDLALLRDYYQVTANVAYKKWNKGDEIDTPKGWPKYKVADIIKNKKGLQIVVITPEKPRTTPNGVPLPPIFCCRGTIPTKSHNIIDDLNEHIGEYSLSESKEVVKETLKTISEAYGPVTIVGHSLGGAIAQNITADNYGEFNANKKPYIKSVISYSAPGVGNKVVEDFKKKKEEIDGQGIRSGENTLDIISYRHIGDIVPMAGGARLPSTSIYKTGSFSLAPTALKEAHSIKKFFPEKPITNDQVNSSLIKKVKRGVIESLRKKLAKIIKHFFEGKISKRQQLKTEVSRITSFVELNPIERKKVVDQEVERKKVIDQEAHLLHESIQYNTHQQQRQFMDLYFQLKNDL